jgi:hypothetical protein
MTEPSRREKLSVVILLAVNRGYGLPEPFDNIADLVEFHHENMVIFSHEFVKHYFVDFLFDWPMCREVEGNRFGWKVEKIHAWQLHLMRMVLSEDPVEYLWNYRWG